jgi:hypothetical protein
MCLGVVARTIWRTQPKGTTMLLPNPTTLRLQARWHAEQLAHEAELRRLARGEPVLPEAADQTFGPQPRHLLLAFRQLAARLHWPPTSLQH